jgi:hypothetical protein
MGLFGDNKDNVAKGPEAKFRDQVHNAVSEKDILDNAKFALRRWRSGNSNAEDILSLNMLVERLAGRAQAAKALGISEDELNSAIGSV